MGLVRDPQHRLFYKPFDGIEIALTRQALGQPKSERLPGDALTLEQALYGYTLGGARLMKKEQVIGSLEQGKKADIIVLDRDIHKQVEDNVHELNETKILRTYLGGKIVHRDEEEDIEQNMPDQRTSIL